MDINNHFSKKIYVIIPVFNCKKYLRQSVESIILQPYQAIRIVLVDDGSTDGSSELCEELANQDKRITVLHQINGGVASARNKGLEYILSIREDVDNYIAFLDADDAWKSNWINAQLVKLMMQGYDLIGLQSCICNHLLTKRTEEVFVKEGEYQGGVASIWIHSMQHMGAMLYRVNLIEQYGIRFFNIKASEDKIFSMQCLYLAKKIYLINQLMYLYRQNPMSTIHMRKKGVPYFEPIIDAYIKLDKEMIQWKSGVRGEFNEGKTLAKIYIMDMAEEEYESWNGAKRIEDFLIKNIEYQEILERQTGNVQVEERWLYMQKHKQKIIIKKWIHGFLYKIIHRIYYIPWVNNMIDKKRYTVKI